MGLFSNSSRDKYASKAQIQDNQPTWPEPQDPRLPGIAGYVGMGLKKNAMPEMRFNYVRPEDQPKR